MAMSAFGAPSAAALRFRGFVEIGLTSHRCELSVKRVKQSVVAKSDKLFRPGCKQLSQSVLFGYFDRKSSRISGDQGSQYGISTKLRLRPC
jgi:hypothetical protein